MALTTLLLLLPLFALSPLGLTAVKLPDLAQLAQAVRTGDEVEIERVAARLGAVRLIKIAEHGRREERLAALRALQVVDDSWAVLVELGRLLSDRDLDIAGAAALSSRRVCEALTRERAEAAEMPRDIPEEAARELIRRAADGALPLSVRTNAIAAVAALKTTCRVDDPGLAKLLADPEAQIRRAVSEALAGSVGQERALENTLAADSAAEVAATAAAALCRDVPPAGDKGAAIERARRLGPPARVRLRALATDEKISLADRLDLLPCLRVAAQPDDQKVLDLLAKRAPDSLRRRARSLGGK